MKLIFFNRFFHPDTSATSQMLSDLAFHLASRGVDVHVVTSRSTEAGTASLERVRGVTIHRVSTAPGAPHGLPRRALAYAGFYRAARRAAAELAEPGDVVVLKTDPPLLGAAVSRVALRKGAKVVNWIQDLFPEVAERHGIPGARGLLGALLRRIRNRSLRLASRIVVIGDQMAAHVEKQNGIDPGKIVVIHNWADGRVIQPLPPASNAFRKGWALNGAFVVGYSGNLGRVHEFDTLLDAAKLLSAERDICFLFVGRGPRLDEVRRRVEAEGMANVRFEPPQSRESLSQSLGVADVHVSTLLPCFEGLVHPSKLYGVMAAGRPTLFIGDERGETARILDRDGAGVSVATGNSEGVAREIRALRDDPARRQAMGEHARQALDAKYDMRIALSQWESLLGSVGVRMGTAAH